MQTISELKRLVIGPSDLSKTFNYFFDLTDNNVIVKHRILHRHEIENSDELLCCKCSIENILSEHLKKSVKVNDLVLQLVPNESLYHGLATLSGSSLPSVVVIYFSDIQMCAFALSQPDGMVDYFRVSIIPVASTKTGNSSTLH